jgi:outer membrane protein TolC
MRSKRTGFAAILLVISFFQFSQQAPAGEEPNGPQRLEEYIRYAVEHNTGLKSHFEQWRQAVLAVRPAGTLEDPRFEYDYFVYQSPMGDQYRLKLMQTFPWFGVLETRKDAAAAAARAARERYESAYRELVWQVQQAFYEYAYLYRAMEIARQNLDLLKSFEQTAQIRYRTAAGTHPDIVRAQIELAQMEDYLVSLEQMREPISAGLNALLNRSSQQLLPWPAVQMPPLADVNEADVLHVLRSSNPELKSFQMDAVAARHQVELAEKRFYPNVSLGLEWMELDGNSMRTEHHDPLAAMVSINLPLWADSYRDQLRQAQSRVRQIRRKMEQKELDLVSELSQAVFELGDTRRKAVLYRDILVPKAREMVLASEEAYRVGQVDFLSLIDAQKTKLRYELAYERALMDHILQQARIERLAGREIFEKGEKDISKK